MNPAGAAKAPAGLLYRKPEGGERHPRKVVVFVVSLYQPTTAEANEAFTFVPTVRTEAMTTTRINANITAYSVAVGPSS